MSDNVRIAKYLRMECLDVISELPDDLLSDILSRIPLKEATRTCVLSKAWETKWILVQNVKLSFLINKGDVALEDDFVPWGCYSIFVQTVERIIQHLQNIKSLHLTDEHGWPDIKLISLISDALSGNNNLESLELRIPFFEDENVGLRMLTDQSMVVDDEDQSLHPTVINCTPLRNLVVNLPCSFEVGVGDCFPNLTRLWLKKVAIEHSMEMLVFAFPVLKELVLSECEWVEVSFVEINAPSLNTFKCETPSEQGKGTVDNFSITINGARLTKFKLHGGYPENIILNDTTAKRVIIRCSRDASLSYEEQDLRVQKLLRGFTNLESLELYGYYPPKSNVGLTLPMFYNNLDTLILIHPCYTELRDLLFAMPILKVLKIDMVYGVGIYDYAKPVPSCITSHLKEVIFEYFDVEEESGFPFERYLLRNARKLKKVYVCMRDSDYKAIDTRAKAFSKYRRASRDLKVDIMLG